jgi:hypothetical protein
LAVLAAGVSARGPERARFRVTVTGTDQASWSYRYPEPATRSCNGQDRVGNGSQTVRYSTAHPVTISARSASGQPKLGPGPMDSARFPVAATITRQSTVTGCVSNEPQDPPDCGTKQFSIPGNLRYLDVARLGLFSIAASAVHPFQNCPNFNGEVGVNDPVGVGVRAARARLSEKKLLRGRKRSFDVTGTGSERDRTVLFQSSWKAHFRRLR